MADVSGCDWAWSADADKAASSRIWMVTRFNGRESIRVGGPRKPDQWQRPTDGRWLWTKARFFATEHGIGSSSGRKFTCETTLTNALSDPGPGLRPLLVAQQPEC